MKDPLIIAAIITAVATIVAAVIGVLKKQRHSAIKPNEPTLPNVAGKWEIRLANANTVDHPKCYMKIEQKEDKIVANSIYRSINEKAKPKLETFNIRVNFAPANLSCSSTKSAVKGISLVQQC